jgi:hypothetical protein
MFLEARGIALSVPKQVTGVLTPDGQFQWGDAIYNVEGECSTLSKDSDQVVRNVKKARSAGYRVLIVLPSQSGVPRTLEVLEKGFPGLRPGVTGWGWSGGRGGRRSEPPPNRERRSGRSWKAEALQSRKNLLRNLMLGRSPSNRLTPSTNWCAPPSATW